MGLHRVELVFTDPICGCQYQEHEWGYDNDGIWLKCVLCKAFLRTVVARAAVTFAKPYPKGIKSVADKGLDAARKFLGGLKKEQGK